MYAMIRTGEPAQVAAQDLLGNVARVEGAVPEAAVNVPLTAEKVEGQLKRTGRHSLRVREGHRLCG